MSETLQLLGEGDVRSLLDTATALELARTTLRKQAHDGSCLSHPSAMLLDATSMGGPRFKFKAATVGYLRTSGIRLIARRGGNTGYDASNFTAVYDHETGSLNGLVSEIWLSRLRTAAFGVASVESLVNSGPLTVGLFGAGDVAAELVPLLALALPLAEVRVRSRRRERTEAFVERFRRLVGCPMRVEPEPRRVVAGAQLVITATEATEPLIEPHWIEPGTVLCSMGSYNEIAFEVLDEIDRLIVDDPDYASTMGDGGAWIKQGRLSRAGLEARITALACEIVAGAKPGRIDPAERILTLIQGVATGDVAFALHALRLARARGVGRTVELA